MSMNPWDAFAILGEDKAIKCFTNKVYDKENPFKWCVGDCVDSEIEEQACKTLMEDFFFKLKVWQPEDVDDYISEQVEKTGKTEEQVIEDLLDKFTAWLAKVEIDMENKPMGLAVALYIMQGKDEDVFEAFIDGIWDVDPFNGINFYNGTQEETKALETILKQYYEDEWDSKTESEVAEKMGRIIENALENAEEENPNADEEEIRELAYEDVYELMTDSFIHWYAEQKYLYGLM